jgi:hypothetical protein
MCRVVPITAAARFADVCEDDINFILENRDAKNTKLIVKSRLNILKVYCDEKNLPFARLSKCLRLTCVRESDIFTLLCGSKKEDYIKKKSMVSIRYGLQKHFHMH